MRLNQRQLSATNNEPLTPDLARKRLMIIPISGRSASRPDYSRHNYNRVRQNNSPGLKYRFLEVVNASKGFN